MTILNQKDEFKVLERHEKYDIKFMSASEVNKNAELIFKNVSLTDFKQGDIGNCALIAALAAISQRPEFLSEIAPNIKHTSEGIKVHFKMFYKGNPVVVTIDDKLPYLFSDDKISLIYAKSANGDSLYLASLFEKAVVKLVCNSNYNNSEGIQPYNVFSLFSECMVSCCVLLKTDSKQNVIDYLKYEVDNKSSVVLCITPDVIFKPDSISKRGHAYVIMDYNLEHKAIKLYDPRFCKKTFDICNNLPVSFTEKADPKKGELWITLDRLEKRILFIDSMCLKNFYKSVFKASKNFKSANFNKSYCIGKYSCKVDIKENSTFLINLFLFSHRAADFKFNIYTTDVERKKVKTNYEIPQPFFYNEFQNNGEFYQRFDLKPNKYIFQFEIQCEKSNLDEIEFLLKIGSVSECTFEEVVEEENV